MKRGKVCFVEIVEKKSRMEACSVRCVEANSRGRRIHMVQASRL